jgi:thioredoxin 1
MKSRLSVKVALAALALAVASHHGLAQTAGTTYVVNTAAFAPFEQWKNAVLAGDSAALKTFYSTTPATKVTAAAKPSTADEDVAFWLDLKPRSLKADSPQTSTPQPGIEVIQFEAEIQSGKSGKETLYVTEGQAWQQQGTEWRLVVVQRTGAAYLQQPANQDKNIYPAGVDAHTEIKEAEEKAAKEQKRILLVFGANWCYDCHVLDLAFHRPDFATVIAGYEVVHVDIGDDGKKNADVAKEFQVPLDKGVPAVAVLESNGKVVVSQKNGEFENARAMTPQAMLEFLNKWKPQAR